MSVLCYVISYRPPLDPPIFPAVTKLMQIYLNKMQGTFVHKYVSSSKSKSCNLLDIKIFH